MGASWGPLGASSARLGASWPHLGASWSVLEASWAALGRENHPKTSVLEAFRVAKPPLTQNIFAKNVWGSICHRFWVRKWSLGTYKIIDFHWFFKVFLLVGMLHNKRRFGSILERFGGVLEASWGVLGASWAVSGPSWGLLRSSWCHLGASCALLGRS